MTAILVEESTAPAEINDDVTHYWCSDCYPEGCTQFSYCGLDVTDDPIRPTGTEKDCIFCQAVEDFYDGCSGCGE